MKIALISDIHIDINKDYPVLETVAEAAVLKGADVLVIAGDISETPENTIAAMEQLEHLSGCQVYYVPGNHDMWNKNCPSAKTEDIYAGYVQDARCLSGKHVLLEKGDVKLALTGDIGWYDYSMASPGYSQELLDGMSVGGRTWQDKFFNQWTADNKGQMMISLNQLEQQLAACGDARVMVVTHMLPVREFCVSTAKKDWSFFNAFLGSTALEDLYKRYAVRYAVCGHVHHRSEMEKDGIRHICPCLGYYSEWPMFGLEDDSLKKHVENAMYVLEI